MTESCHNCRYSRSRPHSGLAQDSSSVNAPSAWGATIVECHRYPPLVRGRNDGGIGNVGDAAWPRVSPGSWIIPWCAEWAPQAPEETP